FVAVFVDCAMTSSPLSPAAASMRGLREWLPVLLIVCLGLVPRLIMLDRAPGGLWYDEALNGENARSILAGERPLFFYPDGYPQEPLYFYLQAASLWAFSEGQPAVWPLRFVSVVIGTLTLAAFYLFARGGLPRMWALLATLVMAFFPW